MSASSLTLIIPFLKRREASGTIKSSFLSHLDRFFFSSLVQYSLVAECNWDLDTSFMLCMPKAQRMTAVALCLANSIQRKMQVAK